GSSIRSKSDLSIIAGDVEGAGAFKILESLTTRFFFLEQHDLIINTSSMTGGVRRSENIRHFFHQGPHVSHFHYFSNPVSLEHIVAGLDWKTGIEPEGFEIINKSTKGNRSYFELPEFSPKKASIVIIPGIFGSHIKPNNKRIWLNWNAITHGCFNKLKFENTNDASDGLVAKKYHNLIQFLSQSYNVIIFPYDWRLSLLNSSNKLTETLKKLLEKTKSEGLPIHLLAHSTGGLVARLITNNKSNIWQEMVSRNSRLLMLGTPHRGSFAFSRLLMGQDRLSQLLTIAHFRDNKIPSEKSTIVETLASFPGLLELMPLRSEFNFFHTQSWNKQPDSLVTPSHECLKAAKELQQTHLDKTTLDGNMFIILGSSRETPNKFSKDKWEFSNTNQGDGFATWKSCRLQNIQTWYMNTSHGEMANNELAFPAIQQILETGDTNHLPRHANDFESTSQTEILSQQRSFLFPSKDELLDTSMSVIAKTASP
ncbi:MAG: hypothetical protein KAG86_09765, partial [Gammaproteobacteria bacterium]|nr:hypothetical protein [Gammaproteobacteria bacterium]